ncbi:MAG: restriction endonuclease subunit S [Ignavibacteriales bacterium]|nr:restriction endonuclease subunit S [Ignavibacteriales bacterium]
MKKSESGWQVKYFGEVASVKTGYPFDSKLFNEVEGFPIIRIRDIKRGATSTYYKGEILQDYLIKKGDYLIGMDGEFNLAEWKSEEALLNQRACKIVFDDQLINPKYGFYFLPKKLKEIEDSTSFVTVKHISHKQILKIQIPLPPLPIQKQIAEILERADKAKQKRKEANKLTDEFLQSVFIEMFGDPNTNTNGWDTGIINDALEYSDYGTSNKSNHEKLGYPVLGMANITYEGQLDLTKLSFVELTDDEFNKLKLEQGDIIFNRTNSTELVGKTTYWNKNLDAVLASYLVKLRLNKKFNLVVFSFLLNTTHFKTMFISRCKKAVGQSNISPTLLKEFPIYFPPLSLQQQFAEIVNKTEALKEKQKQSKQELENLFQSLMQKAFKGELVI